MLDTASLSYALRELVKLLVDDLRQGAAEDPAIGARLDAEHQRLVDSGRSAALREVARQDQLIQIAVAWVLGTVFVRFAEDNRLIDTPFIGGPRGHEEADARRHDFFRANPQCDDRDWLIAAFDHLADSHPALAELFSRRHSPLWMAMPSSDVATTLLGSWRRRTHHGCLAYDLTDANLDTQFLTTLYQGLSEQASSTYALVPTPSFVVDQVLDFTLAPLFDKRGLKGLRVLDPACGSGGFVLGTFRHLVQRWKEEAPELPAEQLVGLALAAVHGVDLNPFAAAVTRFRLLTAALHAAGHSTFKTAKDAGWHLSIAVGDSLLGASDNPPSTEDLGDHPMILAAGRYHAVVGNPPYITVKDRLLDQRYRERYDACTGMYSLVIPFIQLFFRLARRADESGDAGYVGLLAANSFMKRAFGRKLIEDFFAKTVTLTHIVDTSGAFIPGHGTPTVILAGRNRSAHATDPVLTVHGLRGEPAVPKSPAEGLVWQSIVQASLHPGYMSHWTQSLLLDQDTFWKFPWNLGGSGVSKLLEIMSTGGPALHDAVTRIGYFASTGSDDVFTAPPGAFHRAGAEEGPEIIDVITGSEVRDWSATPRAEAFFPRNSRLKPVDLQRYPGHARRLWPYRSALGGRPNFSGGSYFQAGRAWYDWHQVSGFPKEHPHVITFSWVATHNHFALLRDRVAPLNSAPVIELDNTKSEEYAVRLTATLNTSAACFWLKQHSQGKGRPRVDQTGSGEPWTEIYEFTAGHLKNMPLPGRLPTRRAVELDRAARARDALRPERVTPTTDALAAARQQWELIRSKMIALQEELDWEVYGEYGFLDTSDLVAPDNVPPLNVGERAFEIVLARKIAAGEATTGWFTSHGVPLVTALPTHWPATYRKLVERRIAALEQRAGLSILEKPEFKRRWAGESWEKLQHNALRNWLLHKCEVPDLWFEQGHARPRTPGEMAEQLTRDPAVNEVIAIYAPGIPAAEVFGDLLGDSHLPCTAALRYRDSGLRKHEEWKRIWAAQRAEDRALAAGHQTEAASIRSSEPVPPKFTSADFLKISYWRQRGKLDVPNERFISYPGPGSETFFGWAGWDHAQRAEALGLVIEEGDNTSNGTSAELVPLLAGFDELIPWLAQWHCSVAPKWTSFRDAKLDRHGISEHDLAAWRPPEPRRGRPPKPKP
jgi:hypothetical protein